MRAVVLVGGFGTRLRPLTLDTPKQMLPVVNRPMIQRVLDHLAGHGVDEAVLSLGFRPDAFRAAFPDGMCGGVRVHYAVDPEPLDTAGAIRFAAMEAGFVDERLVVMNGDVLTDLDVGALIRFHDAHGAEGSIALHRVDEPSRYGVVPTDDDGRVLAFVEKPPPGEAPTDLINAGTYILEPAALRRIAADGPSSIERVTFPQMVEDSVLYAIDGDAYWIDTGTPETFLQAQLDLLDGTRGIAEAGVDPAAEVASDATVVRSVLGAGAAVRPGALVNGSVVMAGATIADGASVSGSIVADGAVVGAGASLTGCTIGHDQVIAEGASLDGAKVPDPEAG